MQAADESSKRLIDETSSVDRFSDTSSDKNGKYHQEEFDFAEVRPSLFLTLPSSSSPLSHALARPCLMSARSLSPGYAATRWQTRQRLLIVFVSTRSGTRSSWQVQTPQLQARETYRKRQLRKRRRARLRCVFTSPPSPALLRSRSHARLSVSSVSSGDGSSGDPLDRVRARLYLEHGFVPPPLGALARTQAGETPACACTRSRLLVRVSV
eukprot:6208235-Pleurochrysis_carterae.AAC.1